MTRDQAIGKYGSDAVELVESFYETLPDKDINFKVLVRNDPVFRKILDCIAYVVTINYDEKIYRLFESSTDMCYPSDDCDGKPQEFTAIELVAIEDLCFVKIMKNNEFWWTGNWSRVED